MGDRNPTVLKITMESIPNEIKTHFLSMLPVKYVLRCRSVCKTWRDLIDDHRFAALHFDREIQYCGNGKTTFLFIPHFFVNTLYLVEQVDEEDFIFKTTKISLPIPETISLSLNISNVGSVNGLYCFSYYAHYVRKQERSQIHTVVVCNPFTQQFVKLPELTCPNPGNTDFLTGFGYDPFNSQFKVVFMFHRHPSVTLTANTDAYVFTLGSSSWKKLNNAPNVRCNEDSESVALTGHLHWLLIDNNSLLSFDLASEHFGFIPLPRFGSSHYSCSLTKVDGCLCLVDPQGDIFDLVDEFHVDIWVMKNYGVRESWTKFVVRQSNSPGSYLYNVEPISFWKEGEILLLCNSSMISYNFETGRYTCVGGSHYGQVYPYCGNLIPLQATDQKENLEAMDANIVC